MAARMIASSNRAPAAISTHIHQVMPVPDVPGVEVGDRLVPPGRVTYS